MRLKDQTAVVTGGGQGIGKAISQKLAAEGAAVVILELKKETGQAAADEIKRSGGRALFLATDCTQRAQVDASVAAAVKEWGRVDILVNNIGWARPTFFAEEEEAYWDQVIAINLKTQLLVTHSVLRNSMIPNKKGKIVNLSSDAGRVGQLQGTVYAACKGAVIAFTKSLAREVARYGINVNCICPGPTDTQLYASAIPDNIKGAFVQIIPFKRIGQPSEIADAVGFLASPEANYITGQVLSVSGGLTMAG